MSTARRSDRAAETEVIPAVPVRRSILHAGPRPGPAPGPPPTSQDEGAPFADWRGQAVTGELTAVPLTSRRRPSRGARVRRHLRAALVGTLLAIVAIAGLSAYAAQGVADALQAALNRAHLTVSAPR